MSGIRFEHVMKRYANGVVAVEDFSLEVAEGELMVLVGPSGCGKSTLLRMLAGLEEVTGGKLYLDGRCVNDVPPQERNMAMVFQNYALYPNMTVYENLAFGLRMRLKGGWLSEERRRELADIDGVVRSTAEMLGITELLKRYPKELSGGQCQRVALGRCLVRKPSVFLFDEPLSSLDAKMRAQMRVEIRRLHQQLKATMLYVTHDQAEAMTLADRMAVLNKGQICQLGTPLEIYENPASEFVASFIGMPPMNLLPGERPDEWIGVRAEDLLLGGHDLEGVVEVMEPMGAETYLHLQTPKGRVIARVPASCTCKCGERLSFGIARQVKIPR